MSVTEAQLRFLSSSLDFYKYTLTETTGDVERIRTNTANQKQMLDQNLDNAEKSLLKAQDDVDDAQEAYDAGLAEWNAEHPDDQRLLAGDEDSADASAGGQANNASVKVEESK